MAITLVAIAALAATGAFAQSSVTAYGVVDAAVKNYSVTAGTGTKLINARGVSDGMNAGPRIGFKGTEDLGNGMSANFVIEAGISVTDRAGITGARAAAEGAQMYGVSNSGNMPLGSYSTSGSQNRQTYVGLKDNTVGEIRAGYQYTNMYDLSTNSGYMVGQEQAGGFLHKMFQDKYGDSRANSLTYISPAFSGVTVQAQAGGGSSTSRNYDFTTSNAVGYDGYTKASGQRHSLMATWANGPAKVSLGTTSFKEVLVAGTTTTSYNQYNAASTTAAASANTKNTLTQLGASYDFGVAKLTGTYLSGKREDVTTAANTRDDKATQIGALVPVSGTRATAFVMVGNGTAKKPDGTKDNDYTQSQYGVRYAFSPRTTAYFTHGSAKDKAVLSTAATGIAKNSVTGLGLVHSF